MCYNKANENEVKLMVCNTCGRHIQNEEANFCEYCGTSFRNGNINEIKPPSNYTYSSETGNTSAPRQPHAPEAINVNQNEKNVSLLDWLGSYLIMFIPVVGGIVFFVMLLIWSFSKNISTSKKNWARATLVFYIITIILFIILLVLYIPLLDSTMFQDLLNADANEISNILQEYR